VALARARVTALGYGRELILNLRRRPSVLAAVFLSAVLLAAVLAPASATALDRFEIQVYVAEINDPGQLGLEMHLNYTFEGIQTPEYAGQIPPHHVGRLTLEPALGVTDWLEFGTYLQFMVTPDGSFQYGGWKLRAKFVVPERLQEQWGIPLFLGVNFEIGRMPHSVEEAQWANEIRPIIGWKNDYWLLSVNPIFGYALSGPNQFRFEFEPCAKVSYNTQLGFAVGTEYYAGLGFVGDGFLPPSRQEHLLFGVIDLVEPARSRTGTPAHPSPWEVNLALGGALTSATGQHLIAKAIIGRSF
jgi:hypothetical protein